MYISKRSGMDHTVLPARLQLHHAYLSFVSVHQMAPPLTEIDIQLKLTTHLSTPKA